MPQWTFRHDLQADMRGVTGSLSDALGLARLPEWVADGLEAHTSLTIFADGVPVGLCLADFLGVTTYSPYLLYLDRPGDPDLYREMVRAWHDLYAPRGILVEYGGHCQRLGAAYQDYDLCEFGFDMHERILMEHSLLPPLPAVPLPLSYSLHELRPRDLAEITALILMRPEPGFEKLWDETVAQHNASLFTAPETVVKLGIRYRDELVAMLMGDDYGMIAFISVSPQHSGRGLARYLVTASQERFRMLELEHSTLFVTSRNLPAQRVYTQCGFSETQRFPVWTWAR